MSGEKSNNLRNEIKNFIDATHLLIDKTSEDKTHVHQDELTTFAEKICALHHFSTELLNTNDLDESLFYNARIVKDLTESTIYDSADSAQGYSLINAADFLIKEREISKIQAVMENLIENESASEVLIDNLMVIYKELAA